MRWSLAPGSSGRRGSPAPNCCACSPPTPTSRSPWRRPTRRPAQPVGELYPSLAAAYPDLLLTTFDADAVDGLDVVFLGLPHEASMDLAPQLVGRVGCVVDLSAAFRLKDAALYPRWYGFDHDQPALLAEAVYGLPERHRAELKGARLVATPGCYVTAATLALAPLLDAELLEPTGVIVDAASGVSGAGRAATRHQRLLHRRRELRRLRPARPPPHAGDRAEPRRPGAVHAAPGADEPGHPGHLLRPAGRRCGGLDAAARCAELRRAYAASRSSSSSTARRRRRPRSAPTPPTSRPATTSAPATSSPCAALDNLTKGASGGALQSANVALGLDETAGLPLVGVAP